MKQNNSMELLGPSFLTIYNKNGLPPRPKIRMFLNFHRFSKGTLPFVLPFRTFPGFLNQVSNHSEMQGIQYKHEGVETRKTVRRRRWAEVARIKD